MKYIPLIIAVLSVCALALFGLSLREKTGDVVYGATFSPLYAEELGLSWRPVYNAVLDDLQVRHLRLAAYWPMIEPREGVFDWRSLDYQIHEAGKRDADVVLAIGRRLPRWPECHVPEWAEEKPWEEQKVLILAQVRATIERYKSNPTITMWQVENEPFLPVFASEHCGSIDSAFFDEELALVRSLDSRPIMITDGGNFGTWVQAYRRADIFGTSVYLYFWDEATGAFRTILPPAYYRMKANVMRMFGTKEIILSELSLEPWFGVDVHDLPLDEQLTRLDIEKFEEIVRYANETSLTTQYVWGVEWWFYMRERGHDEYWERAKRLFQK